MAELIISEDFREALKSRIASPEGQKALNDLAHLIAETAFEAMPPDLQASLATEEGMAAFREAWPDIVDAFLFRRGGKSAASARSQNGAKKAAKRRQKPAER